MPALMLDVRNIEALWPGIKNTVIKSARIPDKDKEEYSIFVLRGLYSGLYQAWMAFNWVEGEKEIHAMMVTSLNDDNLTGMRYLYVNGIYGYRVLTNEMILDLDKCMVDFAKSQGCNYIRCETNLDRIEEILKFANYEYESTVYKKEL